MRRTRLFLIGCFVLALASRSAAQDAVAATFLAPPSVGGFPVTTAITRVDIGLGGLAVEFDKKDGPGRWPNTCGNPLADPADSCQETRPDGTVIDMGSLQYSLGFALKVGDQWVASAPIENWHGRTDGSGPIQDQSVTCASGSGQLHCNIFYDGSRWGPLASVHPQPGETIGVFVAAGDARSDFFVVRERSAIVLIQLPAPGATASFAFAPPPAPPAPLPPPIVAPPDTHPPAPPPAPEPPPIETTPAPETPPIPIVTPPSPSKSIGSLLLEIIGGIIGAALALLGVGAFR